MREEKGQEITERRERKRFSFSSQKMRADDPIPALDLNCVSLSFSFVIIRSILTKASRNGVRSILGVLGGSENADGDPDPDPGNDSWDFSTFSGRKALVMREDGSFTVRETGAEREDNDDGDENEGKDEGRGGGEEEAVDFWWVMTSSFLELAICSRELEDRSLIKEREIQEREG